MKWLIDTIQPVATVPLTLDSPDPAVLEMAFKMMEKTPMINSISLEKGRFDSMMPFLDGKDCKIIALCMDDAGIGNHPILTRKNSILRINTAFQRCSCYGSQKSRDRRRAAFCVSRVAIKTKMYYGKRNSIGEGICKIVKNAKNYHSI